MNTSTVVNHDKPDGTRTASGSGNHVCAKANQYEHDASSFETLLSSSHQNDDSNRSENTVMLNEEGNDDAAELPNQSYIRQRNAIYSKRKYYKKKRYIEQLKSSKCQLEACNQKLRDNNAKLEELMQRAMETIAIKEQATAILLPREQKNQQLQALLLLQQQQHRQYQADADVTLSNATAMALHLLSATAPIHHRRMDDRIPSFPDSVVSLSLPAHHNLTTSGVQTALTRQALQQGLPTTPQNTLVSTSSLPESHFFLSAPRNQGPPTVTSSAWSNALSSIPARDNTDQHTRSLIRSLLLQRELEMAGTSSLTSNMNSIAASGDFLSTNHHGHENSSFAIIDALKSLQDQQQQAIRNNSTLSLQQIVLANEQRDSAVAAMAVSEMTNATMASQQQQQLLQNPRTLDHNSLLQYYLSLSRSRE